MTSSQGANGRLRSRGTRLWTCSLLPLENDSNGPASITRATSVPKQNAPDLPIPFLEREMDKELQLPRFSRVDVMMGTKPATETLTARSCIWGETLSTKYRGESSPERSEFTACGYCMFGLRTASRHLQWNCLEGEQYIHYCAFGWNWRNSSPGAFSARG